MPIDIITVDKIDKSLGVNFWTIYGWTENRLWLPFKTNNQWVASLCERAMKTKQRVEIGWRDTQRFGRDIVNVRFLKDDDGF